MRQDGQGLLSWKCGCREVNRVAELLPLSGIGFSFAARFKFAPPNHWANLIRSLVALRDRSTIGHEVDVPNRCSSTIGHEVDVPNRCSSTIGHEVDVPNRCSSTIGREVDVPNRCSSTIGHEVDVPNRCSSTIGHEVDLPDGLFANSMIIIDFHNFYCVTYAFHIL